MPFESFRLPIFLGLLVFFFTVETLWPMRPWQTARWKRWGMHGLLSFFNTLVTRFLIVWPFLAWAQWVQGQGWGIARLIGLRGAAEIAVTVIVFDAFDYWWHRFNHEWPLLWRFHRVHHMDTHVDVTTSLRFHIGELFFSYMAKALWVGAWGPSLAGLVLAEAAITAYAQFHHSNIDFPNRIEAMLRWVHMTPRLHTSHHTVTPRTRNANYSTIFLIWDRLFATLREPDGVEMSSLGLATGRKDYLSPERVLTDPFRHAD